MATMTPPAPPAPAPAQVPAPAKAKLDDAEKDELAALDALEKEASEFNKDAEIDRILKTFKLDAYAVLDLQPGVPESAIKLTYRKKSLLIHPDKTSNPSAPLAFDVLKKASATLMDEKARQSLDDAIADARTLLMRERKLTPDSPEMRGELSAEIKAAWRAKTIEMLVENEQRRRKQARAQLQEEGREQRRVDEETAERKRKREHEVRWEETRDGRIGSWREFQQRGGTGAGAGAGEGKKKKTTTTTTTTKKKLKVLG